jgi:hypothetical protein
MASLVQADPSDEAAVSAEGVRSLRYVDFICSESAMRPIIARVEKELGMPITYVAADPDRSGPKEDFAVNCFAADLADIGRI